MNMKVLMISTDRSIFSEGSRARARMVDYGTIVDELRIVVFARRSLGLRPERLSETVWAHPTSSLGRFLYVRDAVAVGKNFLVPRPTLITTQDPFETAHVGLALKKASGSPLEIQIHTDFLSPFFRRQSLAHRARVRMARAVLSRADGIRVVSERIRKSLDPLLLGGSPPVHILPIFVDREKFFPGTADPAHDLKKKYPQFSFIILMVARLEPEKNIPLALVAMREVVRHYPGAGLVVVGHGSQESVYRRESGRGEGLSDHVVFETTGEALVAEYYRSANLFLQTSLYEGYGMALMEAALSGCPVVTTDVGIASEFIHGAHALVCPAGDGECISASVIRVIEDNELRLRLRVHARERAEALVAGKEESLARHRNAWGRYAGAASSVGTRYADNSRDAHAT